MVLLGLLFITACFGLSDIASLPGLPSLSTRTVAGLVTTNTTYGSQLFVLAFESQSDPVNDPTVLWLQGGPGCSSLFGAMIELGPYLITPSGNFTVNPHSWNKNANLIFIDSPPGTGFSTTNSSDGYDTNERAVSLDLYRALQGYFSFSNGLYRRTKRFYVAGESYAGKYVPFIAATILNATVAPGDFKIPLSGVLIGNGWVAPQYQMKSYVPFLQLHGRISAADAAWAEAQYPLFDKLLAAGNYTAAADIDNGILNQLTNDGNIADPYDISQASDPTTPFIDALQTYLSSSIVQSALKVAPTPNFQFCGSAAYSALGSDEERFAGFQLRWVIDNKLDTVLYNGDLDLICDWIGTRNYTLVLGFANQALFNAAPNVGWLTASGSMGGMVQTYANLALATVKDASHMVPFTRPEAGYDVLDRALNWKWE